ncbi:hypothetical protein BO70DRAFT_180093 [Aspergillus heteromorphus CBS 117.55]|uniref:Uncharacterized protein n=1 Tax=Aspergillus heteromorphus CBS 117.55 TaxID=1448321 RepID=A0A317WPM8_9EURO|nr:uncharacterized protein BO70DRAFT_180093 [Aspergillus heteromorphus CBS 117.55]PWY88373.1 hypothetical protein BO70DRAFT_180093 [Aspergillus heteromorphus CBS 117.55]
MQNFADLVRCLQDPGGLCDLVNCIRSRCTAGRPSSSRAMRTCHFDHSREITFLALSLYILGCECSYLVRSFTACSILK